MKKLPKRDGYKPKRPRRPSDRDIILDAVACKVAQVSARFGMELPPGIAKFIKFGKPR